MQNAIGATGVLGIVTAAVVFAARAAPVWVAASGAGIIVNRVAMTVVARILLMV